MTVHEINETHSLALRSWVASANADGGDFPIQNLPHGVFRARGSGDAFRGGVAIGDQVLDLAAAHAAGAFSGEAAVAAAHAGAAQLNGLLALGPRAWRALRLSLSRILREGAQDDGRAARWLIAQRELEMGVPARIGDYTDMYTSVYHATNIGRLFRPDNPLMPNFKWLPIGYHGRASSIGVSGQNFNRPRGQVLPPGAEAPVFTECKRLAYALELGIWIGPGNAPGAPIALDSVEQHIFGMCLLNDWSARDIQAWEYQPLGPFLAKNFATTISPWIVTLEALAPYRMQWTRAATDPQPLPYLESAANRARGAIDITIESWIETTRMRQAASGPARLSHSSFRHSYWSMGQMVAHHASGGCNLQPGDLIGTGTQSGPTESEAAALIEITAGGKKPVALGSGESRTFLEDGDTVILRGWCEKPGYARIGFGECRATVLPSPA
ncbi:MAG: fumarylacetoacetase [Burkholderiaceae bacterium]|nr:fumarylacetoacetase [Burkholderiaceae bacterium]